MSGVAPRVNISKSTHDRHKREIRRLREQLLGEIASHQTMEQAYETAIKGLKEDRESLRADLAAVTEERDRMREALKPFASPPLYVFDRPLKYVPASMTEDWIGGGWFSTEDFCRARTALEGVTEKEGEGNE